MGDKVKIFVACHIPATVPENPLFVPVQAGASLSSQSFFGMKSDDEGDHISDKNPQYCELTVQYWAWKNVDCDYYGFCHYRRYFSFERIYQVDCEGRLNERKIRPYVEVETIKEDLTRFRLDGDYMKNQIQNYDLLTVLRERVNTTVYRQFCQYHEERYLKLAIKLVIRQNPEYKEAVLEYMNSKEIYYLNMYIMKKEVFYQYMEWLFPILTEFERRSAFEAGGRNEAVGGHEARGGHETSGGHEAGGGHVPGDGPEPRLMGYLAERLFGIFYVHHRRRGLKCGELAYIKFYHTGGEGRGEKSSFAQTYPLKATKFTCKVNMRLVNRLFPAGSRRRVYLRHLFLK